MALLEADPALVEDRFGEKHFRWWAGVREVRTDLVRVYEWPCNSAGGETTHEATYGTGNWDLVDGGRFIVRTQRTGIWREVYTSTGTWAPA